MSTFKMNPTANAFVPFATPTAVDLNPEAAPFLPQALVLDPQAAPFFPEVAQSASLDHDTVAQPKADPSKQLLAAQSTISHTPADRSIVTAWQPDLRILPNNEQCSFSRANGTLPPKSKRRLVRSQAFVHLPSLIREAEENELFQAAGVELSYTTKEYQSSHDITTTLESSAPASPVLTTPTTVREYRFQKENIHRMTPITASPCESPVTNISLLVEQSENRLPSLDLAFKLSSENTPVYTNSGAEEFITAFLTPTRQVSRKTLESASGSPNKSPTPDPCSSPFASSSMYRARTGSSLTKLDLWPNFSDVFEVVSTKYSSSISSSPPRRSLVMSYTPTQTPPKYLIQNATSQCSYASASGSIANPTVASFSSPIHIQAPTEEGAMDYFTAKHDQVHVTPKSKSENKRRRLINWVSQKLNKESYMPLSDKNETEQVMNNKENKAKTKSWIKLKVDTIKRTLCGRK